MKTLLRRYFTVVLAIYLLTLLIPAFQITGHIAGLLVSSSILFVLFKIVKPLINILILPFNLLTLNAGTWIINIATIIIWILLIREVSLTPWSFPGIILGPIALSKATLPHWQTAVVVGIVATLLLQFLSWVFD